jgi:signal transduction histidine kinase
VISLHRLADSIERPTTIVTRQQRAAELLVDHQRQISRQSDYLFLVLMIAQWLGGILLAVCISPQTWDAATPQIHIHVWTAIFFGGAISIAPIALAILCPGEMITRHVIAVAQACWSALFIHLSGGRIETHFHIFGSLAFLAFYRDWKVLLTASLVVAADHMIRGFWWPQSVYGIAIATPYRWMEHAWWIVFEDVFLVIACFRGQQEVKEICERRADLEVTNLEIEERIQRRTQELDDSRAHLKQELEERQRTQAEREELFSELAKFSRAAGMAEVATGILHNVGNVLNSVNVSANIVIDRLKSSRVDTLVKTADVISTQHSLPTFLSEDPRGKTFPRFFNELAENLRSERDTQLEELLSLAKNIDHITDIVSKQQSLSQVRGNMEEIDLLELVEDALKIDDAAFVRHNVSVVRNYGELPLILTERHSVMQILVNLIKNAKQSVNESGQTEKTLTLTITCDETSATIQVKDNGLGIEPEDFPKVFTHGFTTKLEGHGFGLHSCALTAQRLCGSLSVQSEGMGQGATFTLRLPLKTATLCKI